MQYGGRANGLRLFCEVLSIIFLMFYFFEEVNQAERSVFQPNFKNLHKKWLDSSWKLVWRMENCSTVC